VIAPALGGFLIRGYGFAVIFIISASVGGFVLLLSLLLPRDQNKSESLEDDDEITLRQFFLIFKEPRLLPVYAAIVINMFLVGILFGFLPVYLYGIGYTPLGSGSVVSVATFSYLFIQPFAGHVGDKIDMQTSVVLGLLIAALAIVAVTFTSGTILIGIAIAAGIGIGTVWTNSDALIGMLAKQSQLGASIGAAQSFKEFGDMVGPLLVGLVTQLFGVRAGFISCGAVALGCLALLVRSRALRTVKS